MMMNKIAVKVNRYVLKARAKATNRTWRENAAMSKVFNSCVKDVYKEFQRQKRALLRFFDKEKVWDKLEEYSQRVHPELYSEKKMLSKINKEDMNAINKYISGWDKDVKPEQMAKILGIWTPKAANIGGSVALKKLGFKLVFNLKDPAMLKELAVRGVKITGDISARTLNDFRRILVTSYMEEGISPYEVRKLIEGLFEETYHNRAMAIARTETGIASSITQHEAYARNKVEKKEWLATMDDKTRPTHAEANGQIVPIDEPFQVGDAELMHPLDPSGPPEEICGCRCDELPVIEQGVSEEDVWVGEAD
jgi:SPP1 gp7 family putative phage head morphogenesis protein